MADTSIAATNPWRRLGLAVTAGALAALVAVPLVRLVAAGAEEAGSGGAGIGPAVVNTLWTGMTVTLLALVIGVAGALVTERSAAPGRRWLRAGMVLPLLVPPFVAAISWLRAYGPGGMLDDVLGFSLPGLVGPAGIVAVIAVHLAPLAYVVAAAALASSVTPDLERAARLSGAGPFAALATVTLPLMAPALVAGGTLVFVATINSFGIPAVLGIPAGFPTVTTRIYQDLAFAADPASFSRAVLLASGLVVAALAVGVVDRSGRAAPVARPATPSGPVAAPRGRGRLLAAGAWTYLAATSLLPLAALVLMSLTRAVGLSPVPRNWTLDNYAEALSGRFLGALGRSALLAAVAASVVVVLGALLVAGRRSRRGRMLGTAALLTFAVPGSALAVAMTLAYGRWLRDTLLIILLAYLAKFWALGHRTLAGSADAVPDDLRRAARASGAGPVTALRTVAVPLLRPAVVAAWLLVFLFGLHELTMSSLLYGPGTDTLAVVILNLQQLGDVTVTSALAVVITVPVLAGAVAVAAIRRGPSEFGRTE